ncbi:unnamed protein product [Ixodes pacificus]
MSAAAISCREREKSSSVRVSGGSCSTTAPLITSGILQ